MQVETQNTPSITIPADLSGDSVADLDENLKSLLQKNPKVIILDSSQMEHVTSSHINALWQAHQLCKDAGVEMRLKSPSPGLIRVLKVLDLYSVFAKDQDFDASQLRQAVQIELGDRTETYSDEFHADLDSMNAALEEFLKYLKCLHLPETVEYELRTVFYEVTTNIRTHARIERDSLIEFASRVDGSKIVLTFADSGMPFDPTGLATDMDMQTASKNGQSRGFGITLIRKLTDKISYVRRDDAVNVLTIEKRWEQ